ncbi:NAD-dependent succinate-semialdehyde dehydrogenase [bacterium]|nr:NAD-dependent succinate-semialdehyde dehydrogenase [bacterium]
MDIKNKNLLKNSCLINGQWRESAKSFEVINPYNQELIISVPDCGESETLEAIEAAHKSFESWKSQTAEKRSDILYAWYDLIMKNQEDLATILTTEQGKILAEARAEIAYGASYIKWFAEEARRIYGDTIPGKSQDERIIVIKQAVGPVASITPWNFPMAMIARKIAPALAAGCTAVIKPAEDTPLSALAMAYLAEQAGIPNGVLNVITTSDSSTVGKVLCADDRIKKLSFTGSTKVGKILMEQCSPTLKKLSMELGGNAPMIILDDADIDKAVSGTIASKFRNAGQTCVCANRIYVHESIYDTFIEKLENRIKKIKAGSGLESDSKIGPLINQAAVDKVTRLFEEAKSKGARVIIEPEVKEGLLMSAGMIADVTHDMDIAKEEIFGPLAAIYKFSTDEEMLKLANDTEFGLAAYFFGTDPKRIWHIAENLESGMVGINTGLISNVTAPFGGVKHSGFGREGSKYGIEEYIQIKYLNWNLS